MMIGPPVSAQDLPAEDQVGAFVERCLRVFEGVIRRYPDQWCVFVPVWGGEAAPRADAPQAAAAPNKVVAVIPAYNPGPALAGVAAGAAAELGGGESVVVVDDGSSDGAVERARAGGVVLVRHPMNRGKGAALRTGFAAALAAGADWVFTLDADGQHDPREMPVFLAEAAQGRYDLLVGDRMADPRGMPALRVLANRSTSSIISLLAGQRIRDSQSGYRLIAAPVLRAIDLRLDRFDAESEILVKAARAGFRIGTVPIRTIYAEEKSTIQPLRDTIRFIGMILRLAPISFRRPAERRLDRRPRERPALPARKNS
jgi:glycosyltransferase involved in cell wall biosynthesis